ncbi:MAG TPA: hypothetical protein VHC47_15335 [Mucilaginibacter sp.]|nr:hypothetical protein [Mucilaginibacter sp.]
MKKFRILVIASALVLAACSGGPGSINIDTGKKAIVSANGSPLIKVVVDGGGKEVTFQSYDNTKNNSVIYFNSHNPGFLTSEGFGLNKDYFMKLAPSSKYTVASYNSKDEAVSVIVFRTDYKDDIIDVDKK